MKTLYQIRREFAPTVGEREIEVVFESTKKSEIEKDFNRLHRNLGKLFNDVVWVRQGYIIVDGCVEYLICKA